MKKFLPLGLICTVVIIFFSPFFLKNLLPIPLDTIVGLYHPYRDFLVDQFPRGFPFKNFLITDPVRQLYPWRLLSIDLLKQMQFPVWNPYSFSGYPLLANFQSSVFYPLNIFYFLLPFSLVWSLQIVIQPLLAASFLYLYLRKIRINQFAALVGGVTFAFSGFSIAWLEWNSVVQTILWLPLILYIKELLLEKWSWKWGVALLSAELAAFFAGHLQVWFYMFLLSNIYLWIRITQVSYTKEQVLHVWLITCIKKYIPFLGIGVLFFVFSAIQWIPTLQFINLSARGVDQSFSQPGWFLPYQHLIQFVVPDFFGNPATLNYWGVWNYAEFVGYIGIVPLLFVLFAIFARHDKKTYFWSSVCFVSLLFALPTFLAYLPFQLHIPFLSTSQPTRLMAIVDFSLAILTAFGIDYYQKNKKLMFVPVVLIGSIILATWIVVYKHLFGIAPENIIIAKRNLTFSTLLFGISLFVLVVYSLVIPKKKVKIALMLLLFVCIIFDLLRFGNKFTTFMSAVYLYPSTPTITFLEKNIGDYRYRSLDSRILPPNFSDIYKLQSVEGYDPLYIQRYGEFIAAIERNKPDISSPFGFNRIITPHIISSRLINLLGVKYTMNLYDVSSSELVKVFQEGDTKIYENKDVLPRAFFVRSLLPAKTKQEAINLLFDPRISLKDAAIVEGDSREQTFNAGGKVSIALYSPNKIILQTQNNSDGFMILTDIYYPTWHVSIDGKEQRIYLTDYTFRGLFIPKGVHIIVFDVKLF